jgi:tol-pal system protein YbgF
MRPRLPLLVLTAVAAGCASTPPEQDPVQIKLNELDARLARTERIATNQVQVSQRLDEIQDNLRDLRGRIEVLEHSNDALGKQQRDLYNDLDKRLAAATPGAGGGAASGAAGTAAAASAPASNAAAGAAAGNSSSSTEQAVYAQAFDALKAGSYSIAIAGFKDFLGTYPTSALAENAQYWLGEAYYVTHDYDAAGGAFRAVLKKWPESRKAPDALLKLGFTQFEQKQWAAARTTLTAVTQKFPASDAAKLASDKLRRIPAQ